MRVLVTVAVVAVVGCSGQSAPAPPALQTVQYRMYTHCGVLYADFNGTRYYADPPVRDGNWNNPYDDGTLSVVDASTVEFTDPAGNRARFTTHPSGGIPTIYPCD